MAYFEGLFDDKLQEKNLGIKSEIDDGVFFNGLFDDKIKEIEYRKQTDKILQKRFANVLLKDVVIKIAPEKKPPLGFIGKAVKAGFETVKATIEDTAQRIGDLFDSLDSDLNLEPKIKQRRLANFAKVGLGAVNIAFTPITAGFAAGGEIPLIKYPVKLAEKAFELAGRAGAKIAGTALDVLPISQESKEIFKEPIEEMGALATQLYGIKKGLQVTGKFKNSIISKINKRKANNLEITIGEAKKIVNETVKETPVENKGIVRVPIKTETGPQAIDIHTDQRFVLENLIKGNEEINYKVIKSLGKDAGGNTIRSRFEFDHKRQKSTILVTDKTTAANLAHELGHFLDRKTSAEVGSRLSDLLPDYTRNKEAIDSSLAGFAVERLGGNASAADISSGIRRLAESFVNDVNKLAIKEPRLGFSEKFAEAVKEVMTNPERARKKAPDFADFIEYNLKQNDLVAERIKKVATPEMPEIAPGEVKIPVEAKEPVVAPKTPIEPSEVARMTTEKPILPQEVTKKAAEALPIPPEAEVPIIKKKLPKIEPIKIKAESKIADLQIEIGNFETVLNESPAKQLSKYAGRNRELPEVVGYGKSEYAKRGDQIVTELGFKDDMEALTAYEQYKRSRGQLDDLKSQLREVKKETFEDYTPEQLDKINKLAQEATESIQTVQEQTSGLFAGTGLKTGKFVEGRKAFNPEKINAPEDVQKLFEGISETKGQFKRQRISKDNEAVISLAQEVGVSVDDLLRVKPGSIANSETVFKARQLVSDLAQDLRDAIKNIDAETLTPEQAQTVKTKLLRLQGSMKAIAGLRTEASNVFRQFSIESVAGENDIIKSLVSELKKIDKAAGDDISSYLKKSRELIEPTVADKMYHVWYASILSGGSTQIKNVFGNASQLLGEVAVEAVINPRGFPETMKGLYDGLANGKAKFIKIMREGEISKFEERGRKPIKFTLGFEAKPTLVRKLGAKFLNSFDYVGRFMSAVDGFFREGFRGFETRALAREVAIKEGLKGEELKQRAVEIARDPVETIIQEADQFAQRGVYTQKTTGVIGVLAEQLGRAAGKIPGGRLILPFTRIVANVINNSLDWTPLGFKRAIFPEGLIKSMGQKLKGEEFIKLTERQRKQEFGRATLGTTAMIYFASLAAENSLSGNGPSDFNKRRQLEADGWRANSIKILGKWYPYQNWGPPAVGMTLVGNYFDAERYGSLEEKDLTERVTFGIVSSIKSVLDMSFLSGVANLVTAISDVERGGASYFKTFIAQQVTSAIPNLVKQTARYFDPTIYETSTVKEKILSNLRITGGLKPKLNVLGEIVRGEALTQLQPVSIKHDPVWEFLAKNELWISVPSKATNITPIRTRETRPMTSDEYYLYVKDSGPKIKEKILMNLSRLEAMTQEKQSNFIKEIVRDIREKTKKDIEREFLIP